MTDTHIFAVKLSDCSIGYICIMGMIGEHCALALYEAIEDFLDFMGGRPEDIEEDIYDIIDELSDLDESALREIPDFILGQLRELTESGMLPGEEAEKLNKILR